MWDTNMLKRFYEKYVVNWLYRDMGWTDEQKAHGRANLGVDGVESALTETLDEFSANTPFFVGDAEYSAVQKDLGNAASGTGAVSIGFATKSVGDYAFSQGNQTNASADMSYAGGSFSVTNGEDSFAHGNNLKTSNFAEAAFGKYNQTKNGVIFSVGYGDDDYSRSNVLEIENGGEIYIKYNNNIYSLQGLITTLANSIRDLGGTVTF